MKSVWTLTTLTGLATSLLLAAQLHAAVPASTSSKLDKRLAPIAEAAEEHREGPLMSRALLRQSNHANSPFEARWNAAGAVQVYLHYAPDAAGPDIAALRALGATDIVQSKELSVIQAWVPASELKAASNIAGVGRVSLPRYAIHKQITPMGPRYSTGSVTTEGDQILGTAQYRSSTGITGQGITVGVISDGDDHIAASQKSGDLPANIVNDPNDAGSFKSKGDEGTAMMEIVYDLAPGVKRLGFCGPNTSVDFITCLNDFAANVNANVIVDDLAFPGGAMFSDDTFNTAVQSFSSAHPNIRLVTAAGNDALGYWQGNYASPAPVTRSSPVAVNGQTYTQAANFGTVSAPVASLQISLAGIPSGDTIGYIVEWNDPWTDSSTAANDPNDYDVVVFDNANSDASGNASHAAGRLAVACNQGINSSSGGVVATAVTTNTICDQDNSKYLTTTPGRQPIQGSLWVASQLNYYLEVFLRNGTPGTNLKILVFDNTNPYPVSVFPNTPGSIFGHAALPNPAEISVGAVNPTAALSGSYTIENYSSQGPVEYGVTNGSSTAVINPQSIPKPDFAAPDCVSITGAGGFGSPSGGSPVFCGTSAAAPHIAGLVALLMQGYPGQSPYTLLQDAATQPAGSPGQNGTFGFGVPIMTNLLSKGMYPVPAAKITAPTDGATLTAGQSEAFSGTCTADKAVGNLKSDWNFGTGSGIVDSSASAPSVTFASAGTYTVSLKCTGSSGSGSTSISVTVNAPSSGGGSLDLLGLTGLLLSATARRRRR